MIQDINGAQNEAFGADATGVCSHPQHYLLKLIVVCLGWV